MANQPSPLVLLRLKLGELKSAKRHSKISFEEGKIDNIEHAIHIKNLDPLIYNYVEAIEILEINLKEKS